VNTEQIGKVLLTSRLNIAGHTFMSDTTPHVVAAQCSSPSVFCSWST